MNSKQLLTAQIINVIFGANFLFIQMNEEALEGIYEQASTYTLVLFFGSALFIFVSFFVFKLKLDADEINFSTDMSLLQKYLLPNPLMIFAVAFFVQAYWYNWGFLSLVLVTLVFFGYPVYTRVTSVLITIKGKDTLRIYDYSGNFITVERAAIRNITVIWFFMIYKVNYRVNGKIKSKYFFPKGTSPFHRPASVDKLIATLNLPQ